MKLVLLLAASLFMTMSADAQAKRQGRQQARIAEGKASGELSKEEAAKVQRKQRAIRRQTMRDRADGDGFSAAERRKAHRKLNRQSKRIYDEKHDETKK